MDLYDRLKRHVSSRLDMEPSYDREEMGTLSSKSLREDRADKWPFLAKMVWD